ncbi:GNAT family N-acetyltransferase [Vagococcus silagei]|uniref:GNAT family N-acetyltransferase n=1 Tax=Vagococcus silagei TaxID=2508885 RepID=A0A4S3B5X9_9ENTE|nr:GNAT family N-acetyltransferase [Vagococcus silagei]THB61093.1 GNAT family N-acetyltransferase [Vagococcus silagei]
MTLVKQEVKTATEVEELFIVLERIWREVFTPIIGANQVEYMMENYQSPQNIRQEIEDGAHYFLLTLDGKPIGYTAYEINDEQVYISKIYLGSESRGKGLSSEVFNWYEEIGKGKKLHLNVNQGNKLAISVYEHRGFERVGERYVDIGEGYIMDDYIYEKDLTKL